MKNRMMFGMVALFFLTLLVPSGICAESASGLVDTPRTQEVRANEPKTPEDLLRVLKAFMDNPQMNGYDIGEKISGIARENWGEPHKSTIQTVYSPYIRGGKKKPPPGERYSGPWVVTSTTPYFLVDDSHISLDDHDNLRRIGIGGFKETFCLPPALTREILGEPTEISLGESGLSLQYNIACTQKVYAILISYKTMHIQLPKVRNYSRTIIKEQQEFPKIFKDRKDSCATRVYIITLDTRGQQ